MKLPGYFIKHPIIAFVLNALIVFVGYLSLSSIPVREYPDVKLPEFTVIANYPNASADLVETDLTNPLEEQLAGVAGLETLSSKSEQGQTEIYLSFIQGTDIDTALLAIREAVSTARNRLPDKVKDPQIQRNTQSFGAPFMAISLQSQNEDLGKETHYAQRFLKNALRSVKGVSKVEIWGPPYTMQVKLDAQRMYALGINADQVYRALDDQSLTLPVGKFQNQTPSVMNLTLKTEEDFKKVFIEERHGKPIYLSQIANIKLIEDNDVVRVRINGKPGLILGITPTSDANPLEVSDGIRQQVELLKQNLPTGTTLKVILDQADFIRASLKNIQWSIGEAIVLVLLIVFFFLRNLRSTLIPLVTIPISLVGGFIFLNYLGFSINTLTLLAMVLAIGLVVDDAIVVLENITRHLEKGEPLLQAALKGSQEIGFAIVAMTLTLASVFFPIAFIKGAIGQLFIEFAIALAGSVLISGFVALTLSPVMASKFLKDHGDKRLWPEIDRWIEALENLYAKALDKVIPHPKRSFGVMAISLVACGITYSFLPQETAPKEDRSMMGIYVPPIPGREIKDYVAIAQRMETYLKTIPEQEMYLSFIGPWGASTVLTFKPHEKRSRTPAEVVQAVQAYADQIPSANAWPWSWDSGLPGMGAVLEQNELTIAILTVGGFRDLYQVMQGLQQRLNKSNVFKDVRHSLKMDSRAYEIEVDGHRMAKLDLKGPQVAKTIELFFSGDKSLTFEIDGLSYPVELVGQNKPWNLSELYITNPKGHKISLAAFAQIVPSTLPKALEHYNQMRVDYLTVSLKEDQKIAQGMDALWTMLEKDASLASFQKKWTGLAKSFAKESSTLIALFFMAIIFIYAILTIQFESFKHPLIVMATVPLAGIGALFLLLITGQSINIYTQIGFITLVGLITKHGILIVEFANQQLSLGEPLKKAIYKAALLRLRPILMTSGAMILGAFPLIMSGGAGHEARQAIGFVLVGGLLLGSIFTLLVIPPVYIAFQSFDSNDFKRFLKFAIKTIKSKKSPFTKPLA